MRSTKVDFKTKTLNKNVPIPLYYQLKEILLESVKQAEEGEAFPTELELSRQFEVSRPTVRQAIQELIAEGYLRKIKRKGTFVSRPKINQDFLSVLKSFTEEMQEKGLVPATKVLEFKIHACDEKVAEALKVPVGTEVIEFIRLRYANETPIVLAVTFLPAAKFPELISKDIEHSSLHKIIEEGYGYLIDTADRTLEVRAAGERDARLLAIAEGDPLQFIEVITYGYDGIPLEYSLVKYRGDKSKFTFKLKKQRP
jgi:GntR family transcriptional regulator